METSHYDTKTVCFPTRLAVFACVADVLDRLEPCSLADPEIPDSFSDFDDDACTFVTSTFGAKLGPVEN